MPRTARTTWTALVLNLGVIFWARRGLLVQSRTAHYLPVAGRGSRYQC